MSNSSTMDDGIFHIINTLDELTRTLQHKISNLIIQYAGVAANYTNQLTCILYHFAIVNDLSINVSPPSDIEYVGRTNYQSPNVSAVYISQTCRNDNIHLDSDADKLLQEIRNNIKWTITCENIHDFIGKKESKCGIFMKKYNLELTQSEMIAIKLWTLSETLTKYYHIDCSNNRSDKWSLFVNALTAGIVKINQALIINELYDNKIGIFPSIPNSLYRGTKVFNPKCKTCKIDTVLSFSTSLSIASSFAQSSQYEKQNKICVLEILNTKHYLLSGKFIAAPIKWLSIFSDEEEWVMLPSILIFSVKKDSNKKIIGGAMYKLLLTNNAITR